MAAEVTVYILRGNSRSRMIGIALFEGAKAAGYRVRLRSDADYRRPDTPICAFYGFEKNTPRIMQEYRESGRRCVFVDLGYWGRREGGRFEGYHKIAINDRHPTKAIMGKAMPHSRIERWGLRVRPYRKNGRHIVLAGMSDRLARSIGYEPGEWEQQIAEQLRQHTDRPIFYRPKPSWRDAPPIMGTEFHPASDQTLWTALADAWAVVTHHSNVAVDGLVAGIPAMCWDGVAKPMASQDVSEIEALPMLKGRKQWLANIAYWQWNVREIRKGAMWRHLRSEGLI